MKIINVLVADASEANRQYIKKALHTLQVSITETTDGNQAFELIKHKEYDVIFIDIEAPGQSALDVTKKVRDQLGYIFTPIIVMIDSHEPRLIQESFSCGASDYITKPLSDIEIITRLQMRLENRRLERELYHARLAAENANEAKSEFITRLAHELKTPLNAMHGFAQLIESDPEDIKTVKENATHIINAANFQNDLITEVTSLAKIEAGVIDIDLSNIELLATIKEAIMLTEPMANKFKINIHLPQLLDGTSYIVKADKQRLTQVFINLISNAIKYNKPNGDVHIEIRQSAEDTLTKIGVVDTGHGIEENDIPKLFEVFNRLGAEDSGIEGTGIGLPICKKLVDLMGGTLEVESTKGIGSSFWITFNMAS